MPRPLTAEEHRQGYAVCECGKFCHVFRAAVLKRLPKDYHGELCPECHLWMCAVDKIQPTNVRDEPAPTPSDTAGVFKEGGERF